MLIVSATVAPHSPQALLPGATMSRRGIAMMIDTGARFTVVAEPILAQLGIAPVDETTVRGSMQEAKVCPVYRVAIGLEFQDDYGDSHTKSIPLRVIAGPAATEAISRDFLIRHEGLLGLDFLEHFTFIYDGPGRDFRLTWKW